MDVKTAIHTRRSVRKYNSTPVPKQLVIELLEGANLAPSATNRQPWEFVVVSRLHLDRLENTLKEAFQERVASVREEAMRRAIKDLSLPQEAGGDRLQALGAFYLTLGGAPVAIGVCLPKEKDPWVWKNNISDSGAAIENLLLAAWGKGIDQNLITNVDEMEAIRLAIQLEIKGHEFYKRLAEEASSEFEKTFYQQLAQEESHHFSILHQVEETLMKSTGLG